MVKVKIVGSKNLSQQLGAIGNLTLSDIKRQMTIDTIAMDGDAKKSINSGSRSGKTYKKGKTATHTASAPGEFPKTDEGGLVAGFYFNTKITNNNVVSSLVNKAAHAKYLEFKPAAMGGRPFMRPIYEKWEPIFLKNIRKAAKKAIKKVD